MNLPGLVPGITSSITSISHYSKETYCSLYSEDAVGSCYTNNDKDLYTGNVLPGTGLYTLVPAFPKINLSDKRFARLETEEDKHDLTSIHITDMVSLGNFFVVSYQHGMVIYFQKDNPKKTHILLDLRSTVHYIEPSELGFYGVSFTSTHLYCKYSSEYQRDVLVRYSWSMVDGRPSITSQSELILDWTLNSPTHHGSKPIIGPDGMLWVATGDGTGVGAGPENNPAIDLTKLNGKILRVNISSSISAPTDNPWKKYPYVYAYGFRNPYRITFDEDRLIVANVGNSRYESVYIVQKGKFHGWNRREGTECYYPPTNCDSQDDVLPIFTYPHTCEGPEGGACMKGSCIIGGVVYKGDLFPELKGTYFFSDFSLVPNIYGLTYSNSDPYSNSMVRFKITNDYPCDNFFVGGFLEDEGVLYIFMQGSPSEIYKLTRGTVWDFPILTNGAGRLGW